MNRVKTKFQFVSEAWVNQARIILEDLVSKYGEENSSFSVCETFTDAPLNLSPSRTVSWHFYIEGKTVIVGEEKVNNTNVKINYDYYKASKIAKEIYTKEIIKKQKKDLEKVQKNFEKKGRKFKSPPDYLSELHNRLALITA